MKETISNLKKVYEYGKKYKKNLFIFTFISITFICINIITPIVVAKQIVYLSDSLFKDLIWTSLLILALNFISAINHLILRRNTQVFFRGTTKAIQLDVSLELLKIELSNIDKKSSGTFIERINDDTDEMSRIFTKGMGYLTNILTDIGIYIAIFILNKLVFVIYLIGSIILIIIHLYKVKKVGEKDKIFRANKEKTSGLIAELVRGIRDIKMLYIKDNFMVKLEDNIDNLTESQFALRNTEMNYNFGSETVTGIIHFSIILLLIYLLTNEIITVASALVLYNYKDRVLNNLIEHIGNFLLEVKNFNLSSNRVFSILNDSEFQKEVFGKQHINKIKGNIEFKNVSFAYDDKYVLNDMSFKIKENETVAFVGKSGAGKSTILSLICKLYNINKGKILLDGVDIKTLDEYSIRNNITIISQNPYIFNMSIKDNLRLVKSDASDEEIIKACKLACLAEKIEKLPKKYDTVVGENGVTLSGGERQRLAIARALLQNTEIILFDEATSALDNETQKDIENAINNLKDKYTILIIAHRLSTIISADKIMVVENGQITAVGTHKELLKNKSYKRLYDNEF